LQIFQYILIGIALIIGVLFSLLVLLTGKGDAMSGGGGIRTTFKGKASFEDIMSRWTLGLGAGFMALMIIIDAIGNRLSK